MTLPCPAPDKRAGEPYNMGVSQCKLRPVLGALDRPMSLWPMSMG